MIYLNNLLAFIFSPSVRGGGVATLNDSKTNKNNINDKNC